MGNGRLADGLVVLRGWREAIHLHCRLYLLKEQNAVSLPVRMFLVSIWIYAMSIDSKSIYVLSI